MATGDVTVSLAVEGGVTKTVTLDSATRVLSRTHIAGVDAAIDTDAEWQVCNINKLAKVILSQANAQAQAAASWTPKTFTAAT
jgi:hypothetical protein